MLDTNKRYPAAEGPNEATQNFRLDLQKVQDQKREPTILCLLDHVLGNMMIHYARSHVVHPKQGFKDILEIVLTENLLANGIKLVYLLVGRADILSLPGLVIREAEKLLDGLAKIQSRIMIVVGAVLILPSDSPRDKANIRELNQKLQILSEKDHHWVFFNPNVSVAVAGDPQKWFFDREGKLNKAGCRFVAQALVATSKSARMLQNFDLLLEKL